MKKPTHLPTAKGCTNKNGSGPSEVLGSLIEQIENLDLAESDTSVTMTNQLEQLGSAVQNLTRLSHWLGLIHILKQQDGILVLEKAQFNILLGRADRMCVDDVGFFKQWQMDQGYTSEHEKTREHLLMHLVALFSTKQYTQIYECFSIHTHPIKDPSEQFDYWSYQEIVSIFGRCDPQLFTRYEQSLLKKQVKRVEESKSEKPKHLRM